MGFEVDQTTKNIIILIAAPVLFFVISHGQTYRITNWAIQKLTKYRIATDGCPTWQGVGIHALVFGALIAILLYAVLSDKKETYAAPQNKIKSIKNKKYKSTI